MPRNPSSTGAANARKRIQRELRELRQADMAVFTIEPIEDDLLNLTGHLIGPTDSPFQGGVFKLEVKVPDDYPFSPPQVKFTTRLWHPNISSQTGTICLDILKDQWAASLCVRTVMLSLQGLLTSPEPNDPLDAVVARQYKEKPQMYADTARYWTYVFAIESKTAQMASSFAQFEALISQLTEKLPNRDRGQAMNALSCADWDLTSAFKLLP